MMKKPIPVMENWDYKFKGKDVAFMSNEGIIKFKKFNLKIAEDEMVIEAPDEPPSSLLKISGTVKIDGDMELEKEQISVADSTLFKLKLDEEVFKSLREELFGSQDIRDIFEMEREGLKPLKPLETYMLFNWKWIKTEDV